jgi:hypothetical protein
VGDFKFAQDVATDAALKALESLGEGEEVEEHRFCFSV